MLAFPSGRGTVPEIEPTWACKLEIVMMKNISLIFMDGSQLSLLVKEF